MIKPLVQVVVCTSSWWSAQDPMKVPVFSAAATPVPEAVSVQSCLGFADTLLNSPNGHVVLEGDRYDLNGSDANFLPWIRDVVELLQGGRATPLRVSPKSGGLA